MELKSEGIVLKRYKKGEYDDITVIFTREMGKVMVTSKSTRKHGSKLKPALELFSLNNYFFTRIKKDSKYFTLIQAQPVMMFENMRISLRKIGFSYLVVELMNKFTELEDPHEELYDTAKEIMMLVDSGDYANVENIESYFKLRILKYSGFDITKDASYLKEKKVSKETRELLRKIESTPEAKKLDVEYDIIRDVNMLIDGYIINVLGEDIFSNRFLEGIKDVK